MRKLLTSICAAVALSVPVAALPAANASTATTRPAERTASTPMGDYECTTIPGTLQACTISETIPPGMSLYVHINPPISSTLTKFCDNKAGTVCATIRKFQASTDFAIGKNYTSKVMNYTTIYVTSTRPEDIFYTLSVH
jgi:hypothetical protein